MNAFDRGVESPPQVDSADEEKPLLSTAADKKTVLIHETVWRFLEGEGRIGSIYESFTVVLIFVDVAAFIIGSMYDRQYNVNLATGQYIGPPCPEWCDRAFFGNYKDNGLDGTSYLEIFSTLVFTIDYLLRLWSVPLVTDADVGPIKTSTGEIGRLKYRYDSRFGYAISYLAMVDLVSIVPMYVDLCTPVDFPAVNFVRILRLFRMMRMPGRYGEVFLLFEDVFYENRQMLFTTGFVGLLVWTIAAGFYYIAERNDKQMIYCPKCPGVDVSRCVIDEWGFVDCSNAGCTAPGCTNLFDSIPASMFYTVESLFGAFPLSAQYNTWGRIISTIISVVAVFVFAIPTGIIGNGFNEVMARKKEEWAAQHATDSASQGDYGSFPVRGSRQGTRRVTSFMKDDVDSSTWRGYAYNLVGGTRPSSDVVWFDRIMSLLIVLSTLSFMFETCKWVIANKHLMNTLEMFEFVVVIIFTFEFMLRIYSVGEESDQYEESSDYPELACLWDYLTSYSAVVDMLSIAPFWISFAITGRISSGRYWIVFRSLRLVRLFKVDKYFESFTIFDQVLRAKADFLLLTGFAAIVFWVLFSAILYFTERTNPDPTMKANYKSVPDSMWIALLMLAHQDPLTYYTALGKVVVACVGLFGVGLFGIPVGILGAGFHEWVLEHKSNKLAGEGLSDSSDTDDDDESSSSKISSGSKKRRRAGSYEACSDTPFAKEIDAVLRGQGFWGSVSETFLVTLILTSITVAVLETLPGYSCLGATTIPVCVFFQYVEAVVTIVFTVEYLARIYAAKEKVAYVTSFRACVNLLSFLPWYFIIALPVGLQRICSKWYLFFRVLRLIKLDKYLPDMELLKRVFSLKADAFLVTGVVASIVWLLFSVLLYIAETNDTKDPAGNALPLIGCVEDCTQATRFFNVFAAMPYALLQLTGNYPFTDYDLAGRIVCFFMIFVGASLVSIPSALVADGMQIVVKRVSTTPRQITPNITHSHSLNPRPAVDLPDEAPCEFGEGTWLDRLQTDTNTLLRGEACDLHGHVERSLAGSILNNCIMGLILFNVVVVVCQSVPTLARAAGNSSYSFFNVAETVTVLIFTVEWCLRVFSVTKSRAHDYSRWNYVTSFFGLADLVTILPWYIQVLLTRLHLSDGNLASVFRLFRLFRLLQLERWVSAFQKMSRALDRSSGAIFAASLLALILWVCSSTLFYIAEYDNPNWCTAWEGPKCSEMKIPEDVDGCTCVAREVFGSMPDSLYVIALALVGAWNYTDFTISGKLLSMVLVLFGVGIYAIPVGSLFDSFGAVLKEDIEASRRELAREAEEDLEEADV